MLLFQFARPSGTLFWATPGGGLEDGETFEAAAKREATEELGLDDVALNPLWDAKSDYLFEGRVVLQEARFYLLRVERIEFTPAVLEEHRLERIREARWWTLAELRATEDLIFPEDLSQRLAALRAPPSARG